MSRTITASGADKTLYHVAARELGDPLAWWRIAEASGLTDPLLGPAIVTLTIPDGANPDSGGLPPQS